MMLALHSPAILLAISSDDAGIAKPSDLAGNIKTSAAAGIACIAKSSDSAGTAKSSNSAGNLKSSLITGIAKSSDSAGNLKTSVGAGIAKSSQFLSGAENVEADATSRPELFPSLATAIASFSRLHPCRPYQVPSGLLSTIARWTSYKEIEAQYVGEMISLLTLEPKPFPDGWETMTSVSGVYSRSRRKRS